MHKTFLEQAKDAFAAEKDTDCVNLMLEVIEAQEKRIKELELTVKVNMTAEANHGGMGDDINDEAVEAARLAIEDTLIDFRDSGLSMLTGNNGFVVRNYDGTPSSLIRLRTETGFRIGLRAYLDALEAQ